MNKTRWTYWPWADICYWLEPPAEKSGWRAGWDDYSDGDWDEREGDTATEAMRRFPAGVRRHLLDAIEEPTNMMTLRSRRIGETITDRTCDADDCDRHGTNHWYADRHGNILTGRTEYAVALCATHAEQFADIALDRDETGKTIEVTAR